VPSIEQNAPGWTGLVTWAGTVLSSGVGGVVVVV